MNQQLAIIAQLELLEPSGDVCGLIVDDRIGDSSFCAKIRGAKFRRELFLGIKWVNQTGPFHKALLAQVFCHFLSCAEVRAEGLRSPQPR